MDDMGHVWVLWLGRGTVCGHVEVAWHLGRDAHPRGLVGRPEGGAQGFALESDRSGSGPQPGPSHGTLEQPLTLSEPQALHL